MLGAVTFGHEQMQPVIGLIRELAAEAGRPAWNWAPPAKDSTLAERAEALVGDRIAEAYRIVDKAERQGTLGEIRRWAENAAPRIFGRGRGGALDGPAGRGRGGRDREEGRAEPGPGREAAH